MFLLTLVIIYKKCLKKKLKTIYSFNTRNANSFKRQFEVRFEIHSFNKVNFKKGPRYFHGIPRIKIFKCC